MNYYNYQPQQGYNYSNDRQNSRDVGNSFILRNSAQNILKPNQMYGQGDMSRQYENNPMAQNNFNNNQMKQQDFNSRQNQYNSNIIQQSNNIRAQEDNLRNIDRLNKINSEILRKQYQNQMYDVKNAQSNIRQKQGMIQQIQPNQSFQSEQNVQRHSRQNSQVNSPPKRQIHSSGQPADLQNNIYMNKGYQPSYLPYPPMQNPYGPSFNLQSMPYRPQEDEDDDSKSYKQVGQVIQKQNDIMTSLLNKLNQNNVQPPPQYDYQRKEVDDIEKYLRLQHHMMDLRQPQIIPQYIQNPYDQNNMMVQMMYQQQMMQALMYGQLLRNQDKKESNEQHMSALELMRQQRKEDNLERMIKQLIMQKGGNLEELQNKLDSIAGRKPKPQEVKKPVEDDDDDEDDDEDDDDEDDDGDEVDEEAKKAELEKQRKAEVLKSAVTKIKRVWFRNAFAFIFLNNLRKREEERRLETQQTIPEMQKVSLKAGLLWALVACEKSFSLIRQKPKEDLDIINNVDKLKSTVLDARINNICNLTQFIVDGMLEHADHLPEEIAKYVAVFFQEKSYLPEGVISQLEIDRLEFNQNFGYLVNVSNEQKIMLVGVYFLVKMIVLAVLAHPWSYQLNDTKLKEDEITKTKLLIMSSIIYHIFMEYVKKALNPIQNNTTNIPIKLKPQPLPQTLVHELGKKPQPENGTRYNVVTGLIDYNNLLIIWTQKNDWRTNMLEKIKTLIQQIINKANDISVQADKFEKLENIRQAQEDQKLLPPTVAKTKFDTQLLPNVPVEQQMHLIK